MTLPSSIDIAMACWTCALRSEVYVSSRPASACPSRTSRSFHARLTASRSPEHMPCPAKGGIWCAASPARRSRPSRQRSTQRAWKV
ncbi:hypothetical protein GA0115252_14436 [Streptomyces sp. DfronAA-171]|nr:hypothetical protein GA0115252_14436 [Streptomyces sp. DfronAA-171]